MRLCAWQSLPWFGGSIIVPATTLSIQICKAELVRRHRCLSPGAGNAARTREVLEPARIGANLPSKRLRYSPETMKAFPVSTGPTKSCYKALQ